MGIDEGVTISSGSSSSLAGAICTLVFARTSGSSLNSSNAPVVATRWPLSRPSVTCTLPAVADADGDLAQVRLVLVVDHDGERRAGRARQHRRLRNDERVRHRLRDHLDAEARPGPQLPVRVVCLHPHFDGRVRRVERRADLRDLGRDRDAARPNHVGVVAHRQLRRLGLRHVRADDHLRQIHHRDDRRAARRHLTRIERQVGDDAVDRARDARVRELRLRRLVVALGRVALRGRGLERLIVRESLKVLEPLARDFVLAARLAQGDLRVVDVLLRDRAFLEQTLPAVEDRLLRVERRPSRRGRRAPPSEAPGERSLSPWSRRLPLPDRTPRGSPSWRRRDPDSRARAAAGPRGRGRRAARRLS